MAWRLVYMCSSVATANKFTTSQSDSSHTYHTSCACTSLERVHVTFVTQPVVSNYNLMLIFSGGHVIQMFMLFQACRKEQLVVTQHPTAHSTAELLLLPSIDKHHSTG